MEFLRTKKTLKCLLIGFIAAAFILLTACGEEQRQQAKNLVKQGTTTSEALAAFYDKLADEREVHLRLSAFENSVGGPIVPPAPAAYQEQIDGLRARAKMARKLEAVYSSLGNLIDYDAAGEISGASLDLKHAIEDVAKRKLSIPGLPGVDPDAILKRAVTEIANWYQLRQFDKNAPKAEVILDSIHYLFYREQPVYKHISQDYLTIVRNNVDRLIDQGEANGTVGLTQYADVLGVKLQEAAATTAPRKNFLRFEADRNYERLSSEYENNVNEIDSSLSRLAKAHRELFSKTKAGKA
jgi:hypothetical protein